MTAIPLELITLLGSSLIAGVMKLWSKSIDARRLERAFALQALNARAEIVSQAREYENPGFQWTRRVIALTAVFFVIAFPKIVAVALPETTVWIGYAQVAPGFWFFTAESERIIWEQIHGLVITPLDTHLLSAIVGLYFGGSLTR